MRAWRPAILFYVRPAFTFVAHFALPVAHFFGGRTLLVQYSYIHVPQCASELTIGTVQYSRAGFDENGPGDADSIAEEEGEMGSLGRCFWREGSRCQAPRHDEVTGKMMFFAGVTSNEILVTISNV